MKLNPSGTALSYATFLGGNTSPILVNGLALDSSGAAYVAGAPQLAGRLRPARTKSLMPTEPVL